MKQTQRALGPSVAVVLLLAHACGLEYHRPSRIVPLECISAAIPDAPADTLTVALAERVTLDHAPWAQNTSERVVFGHLYDTLIELDCAETIRPGLAVAWERGDDGRRWTFRLSEDARFWDGVPVTAEDVALCMRDAITRTPVVREALDSVSVAGPGLVTLYVRDSSRFVPAAFCGPAFAIARPSSDFPWPIGTGPFRVVQWGWLSDALERAVTIESVEGNRRATVRFREVSERDGRSTLSRGYDAVVTDDPSEVAYANAHPDLQAIPLPWTTTYVLLSPVRATASGATAPQIAPEVLDRMARDAVRADARAASPWPDGGCSGAHSAPASLAAHPYRNAGRIIHESGDAVARDLASRIAALVSSRDTSSDVDAVRRALPDLQFVDRVVVAGVEAEEIRASLFYGDGLGWVVALSRAQWCACDEWNRLVALAPWMVGDDNTPRNVPLWLVDTRPHLLVRTGKCGVIVGGAGGFRFTWTDPNAERLP